MTIITDSLRMGEAAPLSGLVRVRRRFMRSVHLERDFYDPAALEGYILTPSAVSAARRISAGVSIPQARAVCLTGAYGTGKSACALFVVNALAGPTFDSDTQRDRLIGADQRIAPGFAEMAGAGFWPVLVTGTRQPLTQALVRGLLDALDRMPLRAARDVAKAVRAEADELLAVNLPDTRQLVALFERATSLAIQFDSECRGILLVIDELGKFLEYAAAYPEHGDLHALQDLAEFAVRSGEQPLIVLTILHQAFEEYGQKLSGVQRAEWRKIQGRFTDVPFGDGPDDAVRMVAEAIEHDLPPAFEMALNAVAGDHISELKQLKLIPSSIEPAEFKEVLLRTYPLHPLTLLLLPHAFRRFGQNDRSLFSFLSADEPFSFQNFLDGQSLTASKIPFLDLADVYDYITTSSGAALYTLNTARLWSESEEALHRVRGGDTLQIRLIKTVALLSILGESTRILPSSDVLAFALRGTGVARSDVEAAIADLQSSTVIVYRRFKNAYRLYEGSDVDIEARIRDARVHFTLGSDLLKTASRLDVSAPVVARGHSLRTGSLRFFRTVYCRAASLGDEIERGAGQADGILALCIAANPAELKDAEGRIRTLTAERPDVIVGINVVTEALRETGVAIDTLLWVQENTPELRNDRVAARELGERILDATEAFRAEWERLLSPQAVVQGGCIWYHLGRQEHTSSHRDLQRLVSRACDESFPSTPRILNELVNRRQLSSTAAAARRNLIEAVIERRDQERLGIVGFPPEYSIYISVLESTGIHRRAEDGNWAILPPTDDAALIRVWTAMEAFLFDGELKARDLTELNDLLRAHPFGLSDGLIPLLICALLVHNEGQIALYEEGRFVADLSAATVERMIKHPEDYKLQGFRIAGERQAVIKRFAAGLLSGPNSTPSLVNVARALYRQMNRLPEYAFRTRRLEDANIHVRDLLREAKQPEQLLFVDLPKALKTRPFTTRGDPTNVAQFFERWNAAMSAIVGAYPALLQRIEGVMLKTFDVGSVDELKLRSAAVRDTIMEPRLKAFVTRAADALERTKWIESVAAGAVGRPPSDWNDADEERFESLLPPLASAFSGVEMLLFDRERWAAKAEHTGVRLSVTRDSGQEDARAILVSTADQQEVEEIVAWASQVLEGRLKNKSARFRLAVVAALAERELRGGTA